MTDPNGTLMEEFSRRIYDVIAESIELGYHPHRFEEMLRANGAVRTAKKLVASGELQDGFKTLHKKGRLDLTMEHIMLDEAFRPLFTEAELEAARWRLDQVENDR